MNRLAINIAVILGVVLLLCAVLDRLGMGDVVKDAGNRVREKAGLPESKTGVAASGGKSKYSSEVEQLMGASWHEIRTQPVEMRNRARQKILAEIDRLKDLQVAAKSTEFEAEAKIGENESRRKDLQAILDQGKAAIENPETVYPVTVGNFVYASKRDLLTALAKVRQQADSLAVASTEIHDIPGSSGKKLRELSQRIEMLEKTLAELDNIPILAADKKNTAEVEEGRERATTWTALPSGVKEDLKVDRKEDGYGHDPTEEELMRQAFGE